MGFGIAHELAARLAEARGITNKFARETTYWASRKIDEWDGGSYPGARPRYEGTSVLAGVKIHATGDVTGGHCLLCRGVNVRERYFLLRNSWGRSWGVKGDCKISFADTKELLADDGESVFFSGRHEAPST